MSQPRRPDGSVLPDAHVCDTHCCHPVKPASINGDAKAPDGVEIHQRRGNANGRVTTKEEDEYCRFKFNSAEGDDLYLVFAVATGSDVALERETEGDLLLVDMGEVKCLLRHWISREF